MVGIKDFGMPSCCSDCGLWHYDRDDEPICNISYEDIFDFKKRNDNCPLIEIKTEKNEDKINNIELVIKMPIKDYDTLINHNDDRLPATIARINLYKALKNATPIPKEHGRLIDENDLWFEDIDDISCVTQRNVENAPTIIEADKENKDETDN